MHDNCTSCDKAGCGLTDRSVCNSSQKVYPAPGGGPTSTCHPVPPPPPPPAPPAGVTQRCLSVGSDNDKLGYALSIVCDPAKLDCTPISSATAGNNDTMYWPNDIYAHADWAFDRYWRAVGEDACAQIPNGAAQVYNCSDACTKCEMKAGTTDEDADGVIGYLCGAEPQVMGPLCAPINPGGSMAAASAQDKASYVANLYYQPIACNVASACDFSGHGEVVSC